MLIQASFLIFINAVLLLIGIVNLIQSLGYNKKSSLFQSIGAFALSFLLFLRYVTMNEMIWFIRIIFIIALANLILEVIEATKVYMQAEVNKAKRIKMPESLPEGDDEYEFSGEMTELIVILANLVLSVLLVFLTFFCFV